MVTLSSIDLRRVADALDKMTEMERTDRVRIEGYDTSTPITVGEATVLHVVRLAPPPEAVATRDAYATYALRIREGE